MIKRIFLVFILVIGLVACHRDNNKENILTVTIEPYRYLVESIAGDTWHVRTIVPKGDNPETFDPTPKDLLSISDSKACFMVGGLGFESVWTDKIKELHPSIRIVDTSLGILRSDSDPHLWTSPDNLSIIAHNVCEELCLLDSAGAEGYRHRLRAFDCMLSRTDSLIREKLRYCDERSFLIYHPALTYFAKRYGLEQIAIEHEGKESSPAHLRSVIDEAQKKGIRKILVQVEFDSDNSKVIAQEIDADIYTIEPLSYYWHEQMLHIADVLSLKNNLK